MRYAVERGVIHAVARTSADEVINGRVNQEIARRRAQDSLDEVTSGLKIVSFSARSTKMPRDVADAYREVSNAENERANALQNAWRKYTETLNQTASSAYPKLLEMINEYEVAIATDDEQKQQQLQAELDAAFRDLRLSQERGGTQIRGEVAQRVNEALIYRTEVIEAVRSEAETFELLYEQYRRTPRIFVTRRWQEMRERVFSSPQVEKIYAPTGQLYIVTNADPSIQREKDEKALGGPGSN